jgi:hypothetical protein
VSEALSVLGIVAVVWVSGSVLAMLGYVLGMDVGLKFKVSTFAAVVLWPISLVLLVIRGAREGLSDCLYGEDDEANP